MTIPPPLTPARSDLRDFGFMPLEIVRFRGSDLVAVEDAEAVLAALMLWTAAWHETPAASLSDDDRLLAKAAGYGRAVDSFLRVKAGALRGFVKCSDGRLYHPVVARLANDAWKGKIEQRYRTEMGRIKKHNERDAKDRGGQNQLVLPSFEAFAAHYPDNCPDDRRTLSQGQLELVAETAPSRPDEIASKGQGEGQGQGQGDSRHSPPKPPETEKPPEPEWPSDLHGWTNRLATLAAISIIQPTALARAIDTVKRWQTDGIDLERFAIPAIERYRADHPDQPLHALAFFDGAIRREVAKAGKQPDLSGWTEERKQALLDRLAAERR